MLLVVFTAAIGLAPIVVTALAGMGLMLLTKCLDREDAADALSTQVILIVAVSLALGVALVRTGGADYLTHLYVAAAAGLPNPLILSGLMLVMAILTNIVSNNAAAVIGTPIGQDCEPARPAGGALCAGRVVWRQHELRHPDGLQDQPARP